MRTINSFHVNAVLKTAVVILCELSQDGELIRNSVSVNKN